MKPKDIQKHIEAAEECPSAEYAQAEALTAIAKTLLEILLVLEGIQEKLVKPQ